MSNEATRQGWGEPREALTPIEVERLLERIRMKAGNHDGYLISGHVHSLTAALAGIANPEKLGELLAACQKLKHRKGLPLPDCDWDAGDISRVLAALAAIGDLPAGDAP